MLENIHHKMVSSNDGTGVKITIKVLLVILGLSAVFGDPNQGDNPIVETPLGRIQGFQQKFLGRTVLTFLGIPFAEPPVGELRFKPPVPAKPRDFINATSYSMRCVSDHVVLSSENSEDCLYLNIWRPSNRPKDTSLKPVMVWIYGGGFITGSADSPLYNGLALAGYGDVIVVSLNYRLGALGFLNLGGADDIRGNMAMFDQALALNWIKDNIRCFGGDPDSITLFGQSAGGFSVGLHMVSPITRNLFKRAIMQSGSADGDFDNYNVTRNFAYSWQFVTEVGCAPEGVTVSLENVKDQTGIHQCLQELSVEQIMEVQRKMVGERFLGGTFAPTVDGEFLPEHPSILLEKGEIQSQLQEVMAGVTSDEGSILLHLFLPQHFGEDTPNLSKDEAKRDIELAFAQEIDKDDIENVSKFYLEKYKGPLSYKGVYESYGDYIITCPAIFTSEKLADRNRRVYFYEYNYRSPIGGYLANATWSGVYHSQEIVFVFGLPLLEDGHTEKAEDFSKRIMNTWSAFAKTGKPLDQLGREWPLFTRDDPRYLKLHPDRVNEEVGHHSDACELWREILRRRRQ